MIGIPLKKIIVFYLVLLAPLLAVSQNGCETIASKKAEKLREKASASGNMAIEERLALFKESVEEDGQCLPCRFGLARAQYQYGMEKGRSLESAQKNFEAVVAQCPSYHSDAYYYAGLIAYNNQDYEGAVTYFEGFLNFDKSGGKVSRDFDVKEKDIASVLPEARFYVDFYANPLPYNPKQIAAISTAADEYLPMLSPDNELIFFTRKESVKNKGDLYTREVETFMEAVSKGSDNDFAPPEPLAPPFNVGDNYGGVSLSLDNREMFVTVCKPVSANYKNCDLYVTHFEPAPAGATGNKLKWSGLENLGDAINTPDGWEAQPTLSADGNTLYFASVRATSTPDADGNPSIDIYYAERAADGSWKPAQPIGEPINTPGNDKSPFLHVDSRTMYFSSNGRIGAGGYDIYFSKQNKSGSWSPPKNLGYPLNSPQDEHGLIVSTDGKIALFASSNVQAARGLDIFTFSLPPKARPEKVLILKGDVKNAKGEIVKDARIELKYTETKEIKEVDVNKTDGTYAAVVNLRKDEDVVVSVKSDTEEVAFNTRVFTMADTARTVQKIGLKIEPITAGKTYRINDIQFATASSDLNGASKKVLDEFADYLIENESLIIEIGGHTDNTGDEKKNLVLSADRAFEVFGYLQQMGVTPTRMSFKGYGQTMPLVPNTSEANRAQNRRTEFKIDKR